MEQGRNRIRKWLVVGTCFVVLMMLFATIISCMGIFVKPVSADFGIQRTAFSLTITISSLSMLVSAIIAGKMMQKYDVRLLMMIGTIAAGGCMFIYAFAPSIYFFYIASAIAGASISFACNIPIAIVIRNWFTPSKAGLAMGIALVGSGAGAMVLNPLYTWIIAEHGWRYAFGTAGTIILALVLPLLIFVLRTKPSQGSPSEEAAEDRKAIEEDTGSRQLTGPTLIEALKMPVTWAVFLAYIIVSLINMTFVNQGIPFLTDAGMNAAKAASIIAAGSAVLIAGKVIMGWLDGKIGTRWATSLSALIAVVAFLAFWLTGATGSSIFAAAFIILYGFGAPVSTVSMPMVVATMFGNRDYGTIMGFFCMTPGIGGMLQVVISLVFDKTGSYNLAWIAITIAGITAVIIFTICIHTVNINRNQEKEIQ